MANKIIGIYKIENLVNGKVYIGQSVNIRKRWNDHLYMLNNNRHENDKLQKSWNKHGKTNFSFSVLEKCETREQLNERETYWLNLFKPFVYNLGNTGNVQTTSQEQRQKISKSLKKYFKEHGFDEETKKKLHEKNCGKKLKKSVVEARNIKLHAYWDNHTSNRKGKTLPQKTKDKMSAYWKKFYENEQNKKPICRQIDQYDLNGNYIKSFKSIREATKELGISEETITKVCRHYYKYWSAHGFIFRYKGESVYER